MASKRNKKSLKVCKDTNYKNLHLEDVLCSICQSILIEPVTLPCNHGFCAVCFENSMENTNLVCPLCRTRIGSWLRTAKRNKTLINTVYWKAINETFPQHIQNKLNGIEEQFEDEPPRIILSEPGEIRKEYEDQKEIELEEYRKKREEDIKASEELIRKIQAEEFLQDQQIVPSPSNDLVSVFEMLNNNPSTSKVSLSSDNKKGPIDKYLNKSKSTVPCPDKVDEKQFTCRFLCLDRVQPKSAECSRSAVKKVVLPPIQKVLEREIRRDSSDSIESECRYFKPIDYRHNPPSEGKHPLKVPTRRARIKTFFTVMAPEGNNNFTPSTMNSAFARVVINMERSNPLNDLNHKPLLVRKRKSSTEDEAHGSPKKKPPSSENCDNSKTTTCRQLFSKADLKQLIKTNGSNNIFEASAIQESNGDFVTIKKRLLQEKADFEFALKLQQEFNQSNLASNRRLRTRSSKGQLTLDEMLTTNSYKVK